MLLGLGLVAACSGVVFPALSSRKVDGFLVQGLPAPKGFFLLTTWSKAAADMRANGFAPSSEAIGERANRLRYLADELPKRAAQANVLALCERGSMSFDTLQEPHRSVGERLSRTQLVAALSVGQGSAIAFVSRWDDHISIDACMINPAYMIAGEGAESKLISQLALEAEAEGVGDVRLAPGFQVEGAAFYEALGFRSDAVADESARTAEWQAPRVTLRLAPTATSSAGGGGVKAFGATDSTSAQWAAEAVAATAAPPAGFVWGETF